MLPKHRKLRFELTLFTALVLIFLAARLSAIDAFPPFIDETVHLNYAERIIETASPLEGIDLGRPLTIYWYILFDATAAAPMWVGRAATIIASVITFAAWLAIARLISGVSGMVASAVALTLSTYHLFFERLALADSISAVAVTGAIYAAYRLRFRVSTRDAVLVGVLLFAAVCAKINVLAYYGIPLAAALTLRPHGRRWVDNARWAAAALGTAVVLLVAAILVVRLRGMDFVVNGLWAAGGRNSMSLEMLLSPSRLLGNIELTLTMWFGYFQLPGMLLLAIGLAWLILGRRGYFVLLFAPAVLLWFNIPQENRYWIVPAAQMLVAGALGIVALFRVLRPYARGFAAIIFGFAALGAILNFTTVRFVSSFAPEALTMTVRDFGQYAASDASGFGFEEVFDRLDREGYVERVIGALSNCQGLRFVGIPRGYDVECPPVRPNGQDIEALASLFSRLDGSNTVIILEASPYVPPTAPGRILEVIAPRTGRPTLTLYHLVTRS